ncbi:sensor histidine kinase [Pedobacter agri]|uniref:Histidine kinase n=1 Tax=Pedobacter agri TaxID=454586 RepID=A0A9X3I9L3_9SPHI|nr:histidine kinase [Pedobacter agri]MCX3264673.1 histidine kinase [Pedobacter agri]
MKKLLFSWILILSFQSYAQVRLDTLYNRPFEKGSQYWSYGMSSKYTFTFTVDNETKNVSSIIADPLSARRSVIYLDRAKNISLMCWIYAKSLDNFRYTILENDSVILAKDVIPRTVSKNKNSYYIDFGRFNIVDKTISIVFYEKNKSESDYKFAFYNKDVKPVDLLSAQVIEVFKNPEIKNFKNKEGKFVRREVTTGKVLTLNNGSILFSKNLSYVEIKIKPVENVFLYKVLLQRINNSSEVISKLVQPSWNYDSEGNMVAKLDIDNLSKEGKYELEIIPAIGFRRLTSNKAKKIIFDVSTEKLFSTKQLITSALLFSLIVGAITGGLAVYVKNKQIKEKVAEQAKQKEVAQLKLNSVRSQLNPHFLFNALAGIQNLMNKNEIDNANRYLSKFARLTRNVLDSKELISLTEEKTLLDDYLQMEQLRFGFQYKINASTDLDKENIEIPAMLLQPFVENAVKHGIAEKSNDGEITVTFEKQVSNLVLKISDNGKGFDTTQTYNGLGLALSKNRISLLNTIYKETPFILDIQSDTNGTTVTITLTQWL